MLKEYLGNQHYEDPSTLDEYYAKTVQAFDSCVDFLRDPQRFPNQKINKLVELLWRLIGNKHIPIVLDQWGVSEIFFTVQGRGIEQTPFFILPVDFLNQVNM